MATKRTAPTAADHKAVIDRAAETSASYRFLQARRADRAAGRTRQMTTEEIAAKYACFNKAAGA
jgi:hypothetical protein